MKYTLKEITENPKLVVYIENENQYEQIKKLYLENFPYRYFGKYCYCLKDGSYSESSTKTYCGDGYKDVTIIYFDEIIFPNKERTISLEEARKMFGKHPDIDALLLTKYSKEELFPKKVLPKSWEELDVISGWYFTSDSYLRMSRGGQAIEVNRNVFNTEKQALSTLAKAQLSQLMAVYNEGWEVNWEDGSTKYCIERYENELKYSEFMYTYQFLAFKSKELANEFLTNFEQLIKEYYEM